VKKRRIFRAVLTVAVLGFFAWLGTAFWIFQTASDSLEFDLHSRSVVEITELYKTQVGRVATPRSTEEITTLLRETKGPVSIGGARCSMGGQIAEPDSLHLDMRQFKRVIRFSPEQRTITVQSGITWRDIQDHIDPHDLSIKIMQTYANFTVGGSLSVNAHGRYMGRGPVVQSVRSIQLILADGTLVEASPTQHQELFYAAIGGYGALGVIAEVTLDLATNTKVARRSHTLDTSEYAAFFRDKIKPDATIVFHNADLHPPDFETARAVSWAETSAELTETERLIPRDQEYTWTPRLIHGSASMPLGFAFRQYVLEPLFFAREVVSLRNHEASYDIAELAPPDRQDETFVLREYFVPEPRFDEFVPKMRDIFSKQKVSVVNISVRHASSDPGTLLAWARGDTFAFVVYYRQGTSAEAMARVGEWSREMIDAVLSVGGTYYLPYQNHATREQFRAAYPNSDKFFEIKRRVDPTLRLQNSLVHAYGPSPRAEREAELSALNYDRKPEAQTILTVPEWYLVWNPVEYAEHLERGLPADEFPWLLSVKEYASLYKKVLRASDGIYPPNGEYVTMLRVIGVSTAVEYLVKGAYEGTFGRLFRALSSSEVSPENQVISRAARAYADLIFDEPWYEFRFLPWVGRIWSESPFWGSNFLRRTERKLVFTAEYSVKAAYATLLGFAAKSAYAPANQRIDVVVKKPSGSVQLPQGVESRGNLGRGEELLSVERWREFSEDIPRLAELGFEFQEIAGNGDIVVSLVERQDRAISTRLAPRLFTSQVVSNPKLFRSVWFVRLTDLRSFLTEASAKGARLEHIYDF
jgi:FAD/FMN-containing dehydrogenase